jgi:iron complex outermembrane receptor protein
MVLVALSVPLTTYGESKPGVAAAGAVNLVEGRSTQQGKLEEIVVTAQKRSENLQSVPVSLQVISAQELEQQNQNSLSDLTRTVPSVHVSSSTKSNSLSIRGIGSGEENPGFDQSVAMFADDIYRGRSRMSTANFLDLERIEILKGPQSTFFGNNAIAGALNIISKKPADTFGGYMRALGGMFEEYALEGAAGGPITDTLQARLAATVNGNERGWLKDVNSGERVPRIHNLAGRLTVVYKPTESLDATLKLESSHHKTEGADQDEPIQWVNCPSPPFPTSFGHLNDACSTVVAQGIPVGLDRNEVSMLGGEGNHLSNDEGVLTLNFRRWNHTFTSVTGYSYYDFHVDSNPGGLPTPSLQAEWLEHYHQFSQELRVASPTEQPIEYLVGIYFQTDRLAYDQESTLSFLTPLFQGVQELAPYLPLVDRAGILQSERIESVFGSLTWNATDRLKLTGSLRGSQVNKDYNAHVLWGTSTKLYGGFVEDPGSAQQLVSNLFGFSLGTSPRLTQSSHALMPSARVQYQFNPGVMGYFRYDRGFLAGGFNGADVINFGHITQFGPEHVNAYEIGLKSKWLYDTVLLNLDLFRADYTDLQVSVLKYNCAGAAGCGFIGDLANAAKSRSQGVEFEGQWVPMKDLRLGANVTYLKAYYLSYPNANQTTLQSYCSLPGSGTLYCLQQFPAGVPPVNDLSGQATAYAPKWSGSMTASYGVTLPGDFRLTTELDPYFTTNYYFISGDPIYRTGGYVRLDGRLSFGPQDGRWSIDLIGKNLTDRTIVATRRSLYESSKERPRNIALQFRAEF